MQRRLVLFLIIAFAAVLAVSIAVQAQSNAAPPAPTGPTWQCPRGGPGPMGMGRGRWAGGPGGPRGGRMGYGPAGGPPIATAQQQAEDLGKQLNLTKEQQSKLQNLMETQGVGWRCPWAQQAPPSTGK